MKEVLIRAWCDLAYARGEQVEAREESYTLSFNGQAVDLDLSEQAVKEITEVLAPYMALGRKKPATLAGQKRGRKEQTGPGSPADMREWGRKHGFKISHNKGGYYHSKTLKEAYARHLVETAGKTA